MKKEIKTIILLAGLIIAIIEGVVFIGCATSVKYKEHTGIMQCDIAIMCAEIKSRKGYEAFEISEYIKACFSEVSRRQCKADHFGKETVSYDRKDERYVSYIACLGDK